MVIDDPGDDVGEVAVWLDPEQLAGFDQLSDDRPVLGAAIGAGEQGVFAIEGKCSTPRKPARWAIGRAALRSGA